MISMSLPMCNFTKKESSGTDGHLLQMPMCEDSSKKTIFLKYMQSHILIKYPCTNNVPWKFLYSRFLSACNHAFLLSALA